VYKIKVPERQKNSSLFNSSLNENIVTLYDLNKEGTIVAAKFKIDGSVGPNHHRAGLFIPGMEQLIQVLDKRGYKYFQIVSPLHISNYLGFPLNNIVDLSSYLIPELNNPDNSNMELRNGESTSSLLQHGVTRLVVKIVDNPTPQDIVWDIEANNLR